MAKQAVAVRLTPEVLDWADGYAKARGVSRQVVLEAAIDSFRADCAAGVPEFRAAATKQAALAHDDASVVGVGDCPKRPGTLGHVWKSHRVDPYRSCTYCGLHGREPAVGMGNGGPEGGGYFAQATGERSALFSSLARVPDSVKGVRRSGS